MELILYNMTDDENVINKNMTVVDTITMNLKDLSNIVNPDLRLRFDDVGQVFGCNYAEIPEFNRFYFIRTIQNVNRDIWVLNLECDVLESFKDDIMNSHVEILTGIESGDYQNGSFDVEVKREVEISKSDVTLTKNNTLILSTISGVL